MKYNYKVVLQSPRNSDQFLLGMYEDKKMAKDAWAGMVASGVEHHGIIKPIDPAMIINPVDTDYSHYVWSMIPQGDRKRVMGSDASAELNPDNLMCGSGTYYWLSLMIPRHYTVIDIGCGYGAQSYLFQHHKKYIGVDAFEQDFHDFHLEWFRADGTERYRMTAGRFISEILPTLKLDLEQTFAICNYVPEWNGEDASELVRHTFENCYVFYPSLKKK